MQSDAQIAQNRLDRTRIRTKMKTNTIFSLDFHILLPFKVLFVCIQIASDSTQRARQLVKIAAAKLTTTSVNVGTRRHVLVVIESCHDHGHNLVGEYLEELAAHVIRTRERIDHKVELVFT